MDSVPLDLAFTRLGANVAGRQRPVWANALDGSLVLVCESLGFSRPGAGVLRYSARLSEIPGRSARVPELRESLDAARSGGTPVRLIIQTRGVDGASSRIHVRADLIGSVAEFDGDAYCVDFVRPVDPEVEPPVRKRKR